jgi:dienelactone hydrolase
MVSFRKTYVAFQTRATPPLTVAGVLSVPDIEAGEVAAGGAPAVLICHGSDGVDGRGAFYADALHSAGFATLEIDMWAARGTARGAKGRAASVPQTLPDAFAALSCLASQPEIDPKRVAIIGFSWGGAVTLLSATRRYADALAEPGQAFAAHAAFYPVLWSYNRVPGHEFGDLTAAPVLIQAGADDAYDDEEVNAGFLERLDPQTRTRVRLIVHPNATHAFDRALPAKVINDPYAHRGAGGEVLFEHNPEASDLARETLVQFLIQALGDARSPI